jgi:hypothetical protein
LQAFFARVPKLCPKLIHEIINPSLSRR